MVKNLLQSRGSKLGGRVPSERTLRRWRLADNMPQKQGHPRGRKDDIRGLEDGKLALSGLKSVHFFCLKVIFQGHHVFLQLENFALFASDLN